MALPSGPSTMASKRAGSPSFVWLLANSGLMPTRDVFKSTGSVSVRSMVRPPDSLSLRITSASSGRLVLGNCGSLTAMSALPSASVAGRPSSGLRTGATCSSVRPNLYPANPGASLVESLTAISPSTARAAAGGP